MKVSPRTSTRQSWGCSGPLWLWLKIGVSRKTNVFAEGRSIHVGYILVAGYNIQLKLDTGFHEQAKAFFDFLRQAARRYPVAVSVRKVKDGEYYATLDGTPGAKIDAFLQ